MAFVKGQKPPKAKKGAKKAASKRKPLPVFKPPEDFKACFVRVMLRTDKDGILGDCKALRYKGRPGTDSEKVLPMASFDARTQIRLAMRIAGKNFIASEKKRLPPNSTAVLLIRVGTKAATGGLTTSIKEVAFAEGKGAKPKTMKNKKSPIYRALRKCNRLLPGAFTTLQPFPATKEYKELLEAAQG